MAKRTFVDDMKKSLKEIEEGKATITMSLITYWALLDKAKKTVADKIKKGITKMEKDGHVLPRRNVHYMIDLIMEKEFCSHNSKKEE
ncbi:hypothetical protein LCGC14_0844150 [marine sediment metagenome]|uniref:Uncharacterized protein n=1 Tax=marine sediment metagenome TaxID=412755 RepID=A0A0F9PCA7_9ZZZZ